MTVERDIRNAVKENRIVIGSNKVIRGVKNSAFSQVVFASNCPEDTKKDMDRYSQLSGLEVRPFDGNSSQLGQLCGKPFSVLLIGIKGEGFKNEQ